MKTKAEVEAAFRAELTELLKRWNAELEAADHWQGYAECGEDVRMTVTIPGEWDKDGGTTREWTEIDLGHRVTP